MLWYLKEIGSSPITDLVTSLICDDRRRTLLRALDNMSVLIVVLSKKHTNSELDRLIHRMQLIYVANIYGAGDLNELIVFIPPSQVRSRKYQRLHETVGT